MRKNMYNISIYLDYTAYYEPVINKCTKNNYGIIYYLSNINYLIDFI